MDRALCLYLLSNFATSNKKISMKTKMIVVVVLAAMCVLPLSAKGKKSGISCVRQFTDY